MPLRDSHFAPVKPSLWRPLILTAMIAAGCSKSSPAGPDVSQDPYLGTWTGIVTSQIIGPGTATIVLNSRLQPTPMSFSLLSGHWTFVFPDPKFSASGTVSGGLLPDGSYLVLLFSAASVPCPGTADGTSEKGRSASLVVTGRRMTGDYMDDGCPGGSLDLVRK